MEIRWHHVVSQAAATLDLHSLWGNVIYEFHYSSQTDKLICLYDLSPNARTMQLSGKAQGNLKAFQVKSTVSGGFHCYLNGCSAGGVQNLFCVYGQLLPKETLKPRGTIGILRDADNGHVIQIQLSNIRSCV